VHQVEGGMLDLDSSNGIVVNTLLSALSVSEYATIVARYRAGKERSARDGQYICSRAPYGYRKVSIKEEKGGKYIRSLEIVEEEAEVVRRIFRQRAEGSTVDSIVDRLNADCIPSQSGGLWLHKVVSAMLCNRHYIGKIVYGQKRVAKDTKVDDVGNAKIKRKREKQDTYIEVEGRHKAIIDMATWEKVQSIPVPARVGERHTQNVLAGGIMRCAMCGASYYMSEQGKKRYAVYVHTRTVKECVARGHSFSAKNFFIGMAAQMREDLKGIQAEAELVVDTGRDAKDLLKEKKKEKKKLEKKQEDILDRCNALYLEIDSVDMRKKMVSRYEEQLKEIDSKLSILEKEIASVEKIASEGEIERKSIDLEQAIEYVEHWEEHKEECRAFLVRIIDKIDIELIDRKVRFRLHYKE
jgi:hypothetical protein